MTSLLAGLLHPLLVPAHLMAVLALALLIGQQGWGWSVAIVYVAAVLAGLGAIASAYVPTRTVDGLLAFAALAGLLVALGRPLPRVLGWLLGAATGTTVALDSPPEAISLRDANLTLAGTALGLTIALMLLVQGASRLRLGWQRIGVRILGSWIAASAILVLALRIVR
jgi:urease accessory protein